MRIKYCLLTLAALPLLLGLAAPASAGPPHYRVITEPQAGYQPSTASSTPLARAWT